MVEKDGEYEHDSHCEKNQRQIPEPIVSEVMPPSITLYENSSSLCIRNIIGNLPSNVHLSDQTEDKLFEYKEPVEKAFKHEKFWEDMGQSEPFQVHECPKEKSSESQQCNTVCGSLHCDQHQERTDTGSKHDENVVTNYTHGQIDESIHTEVKPFVCKQCGEAFVNSSHLISHERIHIVEKCYI